jgi:hypothetical protein
MLHMQLTALALAATALALSGCGGSSKSASTTSSAASTPTTTNANVSVHLAPPITIASGPPLTRAAWIAKGDAICTRTLDKLEATTAKTAEQLARLLPEAAVYDRTEANELSKLVPPTAMADSWAQIVDDLQKYGELTAKAAEYARVRNTNEGIPVFDSANRTQQELTTIAKNDGFKICSQP